MPRRRYYAIIYALRRHAASATDAMLIFDEILPGCHMPYCYYVSTYADEILMIMTA